LAASEPSKRNEDPDYTAGTLVRYSVGKYYIEDLNTFRETAARSDEIMLNVTQQDAILAKRQKMPYLVRIEQEPGASGKREANRLVGLLGLYADDIGSDRVTGSKVDRARGLSSQAEVGNVVLVEADWNERWLNHMHNQPDFPHHDIMDTASGAYNTLRDYLQAQEFKGTVARVEPKQRKGDNGRRPEPMRSIRYLGNRSFPFSAGRYNWMVTPGWEREIEAPLAEEIVGRFGQFFEYKE
jgi:predicted phage terminase large subunit-like protein